MLWSGRTRWRSSYGRGGRSADFECGRSTSIPHRRPIPPRGPIDDHERLWSTRSSQEGCVIYGLGATRTHRNVPGENFELRADLNSEYRDKRKDAIKRVIANMTVGKDVSGLFPDVLKNMQTEDLEQKKLVYLYLMNYAKTQPELVILAVNTFVRDSDDPNPLVRALAIRTMGCLRAEKIIDYLCDPLQKCLRDENPYVRKTAALCVAKLYDLKPELVIDNGFLESLQEMVADPNPMVVANAVTALTDIHVQATAQPSTSSDTEKANFVITAAVLQRLLIALNECSEWGRLYLQKPDSAQGLVQTVLNTATKDCDSPDVRDRAYIYWRLLSTDPGAAKAVVLAHRPPISLPQTTVSPALLEELLGEIGSLASVYHKPAETFVGTGRIGTDSLQRKANDVQDLSTQKALQTVVEGQRSENLLDFDDEPSTEGAPSGLAATEALGAPVMNNILASSNPLDDLVSIFGGANLGAAAQAPGAPAPGFGASSSFATSSSAGGGLAGLDFGSPPLPATPAAPTKSPAPVQQAASDDLLGLF
ncbi:ARM repeat-containing protein [Exidia glandulosa HHB12029]|uniref:ARM repeat-containing protein n=1 Tax=Exidia glandulosa HHB12029 TaxID=1314781 RepID=A0A165FDP0_EXIGL|nr:ARM repeat-containing protein [Exidia glandulosa HHB12029]